MDMPEPLSTYNEPPVERIARDESDRRMIAPDRKKDFLSTYAVTGDCSAAAEKHGINQRTANGWLTDPKVIFSVFKERQMRLSAEGAGLAYKVLVDIMTGEGVPIAEKRQAAVAVLRLGGHNEATAAQAVSQQALTVLQDLSEDQLSAHIAQAQSALLALQAPDAPRDTPDSDRYPSLI